jgi:hypothetical protein
MNITRENLINAIAADLNIVDGMSTTNAAIAAIGAIEALGFVIVPREITADMAVEICNRMMATRANEFCAALWDSGIAGSPLYREVK